MIPHDSVNAYTFTATSKPVTQALDSCVPVHIDTSRSQGKPSLITLRGFRASGLIVTENMDHSCEPDP